MTRPVRPRIAAGVLFAALAAGVPFAQTEPAPERPQAARELLDSIRGDLVELRFEKALAALEGVLGDPALTEAERGEALVLRAQAHVAFGDLDAAESDYRQILELRPGYEPAPSLTPEKAMVRFRKVQKATVGHVLVELEPADARLSIDGREVVLPPDRRVALLAGGHELRAQSAGHDPLEQEIAVAAGEESVLRLELVPNARTVILRTVPAGVEVRIDGRAVGVTADTGVGIEEAGELVVEYVPLGEHVYELSKECYRTERVRDTLTVNLLDRSPRRMETAYLVPVRSTLILRGGPRDAEVRLDGATVGRLPLAPHQACPGARDLELRVGARTIWHSVEQLAPSTETVVEIEPRPNVALLGAPSWPPPLAQFASRFNVRRGPPLPPAADLSLPRAWRDLALAPDTDLALAVVAARPEGAADAWYLYSPILRVVQQLDLAPRPERPTWSRPMWGFATVDVASGGVVAAVVRPSGPAASIGLAPGDRVVAVGGRRVETTGELQATLAQASAGVPIELEWVSRGGSPRKGALQAAPGPLLYSEEPDAELAAYRAAWAVVDIACRSPETAASRANLALLFSAFGHHELAVETWRKVDWGAREGIGEGTTQYYLGRALQALGREDEAIAAYRKAAASSSTAFHDEGPPVAPAAADHLADLGQTVDERSNAR